MVRKHMIPYSRYPVQRLAANAPTALFPNGRPCLIPILAMSPLPLTRLCILLTRPL
jgi:hypothetical protein